jgi:hypothetical protein
LTVVTTGEGGGGVSVAAEATLEALPKTAPLFKVPRNAINWKSYAVPSDNPRMLHVRELPTAVPDTGVAHVPLAVELADPHDMGAIA